MTLLGLTGGIGMGKSACADLLRARGISLVDTDDLARRAVEPREPALAAIRQEFGNQFVGEDGRLRREELGRFVFGNPSARRRLEDILHPRIRQLWRDSVEKWRAEGRSLAVVVIPLLFETRAESEFDATVCLACSTVTQRERLFARGWSREEVDLRNRAQLPVEQKIARADYVIWTEGGLEVHAEQLERILERAARLKARARN